MTGLGTQKTLALFMASMLLGMTLWSVGAGWLVAMGAGIFFWALGFAAINSMQQARLIAAAPDLASASVALNTSVLYVGQAVGSGIGGLLFAQEYFHLVGYVGVAFVALACALLAGNVGACEAASIVILDCVGKPEPPLPRRPHSGKCTCRAKARRETAWRASASISAR